jgi:hypothetical protein
LLGKVKVPRTDEDYEMESEEGKKLTIAVEMSSSLRTDPKVYDDKKQKHLKGSTQKL